MTSTLHMMRRAWEDQSRMWNRRIPRFSQVSTIYPMDMIYLSVESWPAKNRNPRILGRTMPEQPQNDEIRDLKCPTSPQRIHLSLDLHHPIKEKFYKRFPKVPLKFYLAPTACYFSAATARPRVQPPSLYHPSHVFP